MTKLSDHFTLQEATHSDTAKARGFKNQPDPVEFAAMQETARQMEVVRELLGNNPVFINSWFRSERTNKAVGGVPTSAHRTGYAVDFRCPGYGSVTDICRAIVASGIKYDQLIWEYGRWVHISFDPKMRQQTLWISSTSGGYQLGLPNVN